MTTKNLKIIIVGKNGSLKCSTIKEFDESELYKKCGFKNSNNFKKQTTWEVKYNKNKYSISLYAKKEGFANSENKYDFPPPVDSTLFFGDCILVGKMKNSNEKDEYISLTTDLWEKLYEKLFGGFENLDATAQEDENEEDELEQIPSHLKTAQGYLKDGFVIDDNLLEDGDDDSNYVDDEYNDDETDNNSIKDEKDSNDLNGVENINIGSELSEDEYSDE